MISLSDEELGSIFYALETVNRILSHAQGREDSYVLRREQFVLIENDEEVIDDQCKNNADMMIFFDEKEIGLMPEEFRKIFTIELPVYVRMKKNGTYEARFRKFGYDLSVSSKNQALLKGKFLKVLRRYAEHSEPVLPVESPKSPHFRDVAARWLDLKRPTIKESSFSFYTGLFEANIFPAIGKRRISLIRQSDLQELLNGYIREGKMRTALKIYQTLKAVFELAVGDELIEKSPMRMIRCPKYEEKKGNALTPTEEREFLEKLEASKCAEEIRKALLFLLYTGIRRSELAEARIEDGFVSVVCAKVRKGYRERRRLIPVTPMLARYFPFDLDALRTVRADALTQAFKRLMPDHHLHELRHTFITRCQECGVAREVVSVWAGHAADGTQTSNVYTHFSREFMKKEGAKVVYELTNEG